MFKSFNKYAVFCKAPTKLSVHDTDMYQFQVIAGGTLQKLVLQIRSIGDKKTAYYWLLWSLHLLCNLIYVVSELHLSRALFPYPDSILYVEIFLKMPWIYMCVCLCMCMYKMPPSNIIINIVIIL